MSIDVNVQNDLVIVTESSEDITVNVSNAAGPAGVGVPVGGSTGQVLKKLSATNYDTYWALDAGGVPYSGATGDVDLGEYELKAGQVEFDQTPTGTAGVGVMRWNDADGTVDLGLKGGNVTLQVGQEQVLRVVNKTGADLLESQYKAVRIRLVSEGGAQGQRLAVVLAQGNNDPDSTTTIGIVTENIDNNQEGFITTSGEVRGINTTGSLQGETWADGDIIYLSPTVPGGITKVKPIAPNHTVVLGYVIYAHAINGKIFTKVDNGYELGELHDVYVPTPSNNDGIFWNTANLRYQNNSIAGVLGYTPLSGSGVAGQVAYWNGTNSQTGSNNLFWDAANARLGIGTNTPAYKFHNVGSAAFNNPGDDAISILNGGYIAMASTRFRGTSSQFQFQDNAYNIKVLFNTTATISYFNSGGNYAFGGTTDSGQRLQVYGDAFIKGSGATSATIGLTIQDSGGANMFRIRNDNRFLFGAQNSFIATGDAVNTSSTNGSIFYITPPQNYDFTGKLGIGVSIASRSISGSTAVNSQVFSISESESGYNPTSGSLTRTYFQISALINQTGGANGITRGLYIAPTLTAAADWRSIEWSNNTGWGLYGAGTANNYLGGSLGIGNTSVSTSSIRLFLQYDVTRTYGIRSDAPISSGANSSINFSSATRISASVSTTNFVHYSSEEISIGAGSSITNHTSFYTGITTGTNVLGFHGNISNGTNKWNLYMGGTADNYLAGKLLINTTTVGTFNLDVNGTARVSGDVDGGNIRATSIASRSGSSAGTFIDFGGTYGRIFAYKWDTSTWYPILLGASQLVLDTSVSLRTEKLIAPTAAFSGTVKFLKDDGTYFGSGETNALYSASSSFSSSNYPSISANSFGIISGLGGGSTDAFIVANKISFQISTGVNSKVAQFSTTTGNFIIQNGGTFTDNTSALIQMNSTTKGFLPPRMTTTQKNAIGTPAAGLQVYDTTLNAVSVYDGATWRNDTDTVTTNRQTASYALALTDRGKLVEMNVATANNLTVPLNSVIAFPIGSKIDLSQYGAGQTTIVATGGVTIRSAGGALKLAAQYSGASLVKIGTDEWYLFGDITV